MSERFSDGSRCFRLALDTLRSCFSSNSGISLPPSSIEAGMTGIDGLPSGQICAVDGLASCIMRVRDGSFARTNPQEKTLAPLENKE